MNNGFSPSPFPPPLRRWWVIGASLTVFLTLSFLPSIHLTMVFIHVT